jgi:hypothetical protein
MTARTGDARSRTGPALYATMAGTGDARSRTGPALYATMARLRPKNGRHEFPFVPSLHGGSGARF